MCLIKCTKSWRIVVRPCIAVNVSIHIRLKSQKTSDFNLSTETLAQHLTGNTKQRVYGFVQSVVVSVLLSKLVRVQLSPWAYFTPERILRIVTI